MLVIGKDTKNINMAISTQLQQFLKTILPDKGFKTAANTRDAIIAGVEESKTYTDEKAAEAVKKVGDQTIGGVKTFESSPILPDATQDQNPVTLKQGVLKTQVKQATGTSETDVMSQKAILELNIVAWVLSDCFVLSNPSFDSNGNISGSIIKWPDGDTGSISNVILGLYGIASIRYNRSDNRYAVLSIIYDQFGTVNNYSVTLS